MSDIALLFSGCGCAVTAALCALMLRRRLSGNGLFVMICAGVFFTGISLAALQLSLYPGSKITVAFDHDLSGVVEKIDGRTSHRSRIWIRVDDNIVDPIAEDQSVPVSGIIRLSTKDHVPPGAIGARIKVKARLFPQPQAMFPGAINHGIHVRVSGVMAGGYTLSPPVIDRSEPNSTDFGLVVTKYRYRVSNWLVGEMGLPQGGIAAALLVGDRRFISAATYTSFRNSGLAHLLAISGLHMGLICFGVIACVRFMGALRPATAARLPVHKIGGVVGIFVALLYVFLSGAAISAVRAFLMAILVVAAILIDRFAITIRNVALAAIIVLVVNPAAIFAAGFQLSFAATTILVLWFERRRSQETRARSGIMAKPLRYVWSLLIMSVLAALATAPFAAQHFGSLTPWGIAANLIAIPLTGFWIMPAGLMVMITQALPELLAAELTPLSIAIMKAGLSLLIQITTVFEQLPLAGIQVVPPGYWLIIIGLTGWLVMALNPSGRKESSQRQRTIGVAILFAAIGLWIIKTPPDIAVLARDRAPVMMIAGEDSATLYAQSKWQTRLSDYFSSGMSLMIAQKIQRDQTQQNKPADKPTNRHITKDGRTIIIVRHWWQLTDACKQVADYVITFITPRYPCTKSTTHIDISKYSSQNHLMWLRGNGGYTVVSTQ